MRTALALSAGLALLTTPVLAADWTGAYAGVGLGYANVEPDNTVDGDGWTYGFQIGYDHDFGDWILGGELEWDGMDVELPGAGVDGIGRAKLKLGYDFGTAYGYGILAAARANTTVGDETGPAYGLGVAFFLTDSWTMSAEYLHHDFDDIDGQGNGATADTINMRVNFRF